MRNIFSQTIGCGPDIVLLHGWGFNSDIWHTITVNLSQNYRLTLIDLPGFGRSAMNLDEYDLATICKYLLPALPAQASYVGWSLGGLVASYLAIYYPERVNRLINVASSPCFVQKSSWPGINLDSFTKFVTLLEDNQRQALLHFISLLVTPEADKAKSAKQLKEMVFQYGIPSANTLASSLHCFLHTDLRMQLQAITMPQLYLFGANDPIVPAKTARALKSSHSQLQIKTVPMGHLPFWKQEPLFIHLLNNFLVHEKITLSA